MAGLYDNGECVCRPIEDYRQDIEALRMAGLSYPAIAAALRHFRGEWITAGQVRYRLDKWGWQPDDRKARGSTVGAADGR